MIRLIHVNHVTGGTIAIDVDPSAIRALYKGSAPDRCVLDPFDSDRFEVLGSPEEVGKKLWPSWNPPGELKKPEVQWVPEYEWVAEGDPVDLTMEIGANGLTLEASTSHTWLCSWCGAHFKSHHVCTVRRNIKGEGVRNSAERDDGT